MPTIRGFVERLEVGRAGLVTASVCQDDGTRAENADGVILAPYIRFVPRHDNEKDERPGERKIDALGPQESVAERSSQENKGGHRHAMQCGA